ncbi:hypothetical protein DFH07DRAFT_1022698 [Mycena maculata]|uniref:Origin recognition complex subunit 6 n=1 Tax=Mycena maculata TaxID=230809 RepID=A0AAD7NYW8_9AGAR|nr:hypothetical protein DFH07DRAFT_1022698 [Mycena maculata]
MAARVKAIADLCYDQKTKEEALRLYRLADRQTAVGSGFDLGEDRSALPAVCAYIASQNLNNTNVTIEAAQIASCQRMLKFKKLCEHVQKALAARRPARRKPLAYKSLLQDDCTDVSVAAVGDWMDKVEILVREKLQDDEDDTRSDDEVTLAVFIAVCKIVSGHRLQSLEEKYNTCNAASMTQLAKVIKAVCGRAMEAEIRDAYTTALSATVKTASSSPRKSPAKPARVLPSRDSPQKRKVTFPDDAEDDGANTPDSPSKKQKVTQAAAALAKVEAIRTRTRSMSSSPTKPPPALSTPRKVGRPASPSKSPTKPRAPATPSRVVKLPIDDPPSSSDEDDYAPPPRRRFRPVFRDQTQWALRDPRLAKLARAADEHTKRMIKRYGLPFPDLRHDADGDVPMDSD